jgi:hypothetical protein
MKRLVARSVKSFTTRNVGRRTQDAQDTVAKAIRRKVKKSSSAQKISSQVQVTTIPERMIRIPIGGTSLSQMKEKKNQPTGMGFSVVCFGPSLFFLFLGAVPDWNGKNLMRLPLTKGLFPECNQVGQLRFFDSARVIHWFSC